MSGEREQALRLRTAQAVDRWADTRAERARRGPLAMPGDVFLLGEGDEVMEWVVLQVDAAGDRALAAPADTHSMTGRTDLHVDDGGSGPLTLRCGSASWIDLGVLAIERLSGFVEKTTAERALDLWHRIQAGGLSKAAVTESDIDAEYRELLAETAQKGKSILERAKAAKRPAERPAPVPFPERQAASRVPRWRAALPRMMPALLPALSLGLCALLVWQGRDNAALGERLRLEQEYRRRLEAKAEPTSPGSTRPEERTSRSGTVAPPPLVNVPLAWLTPQETVRGRTPAVTVPSGEYVFLVLEVLDRGRVAEYQLEVRREGGADPVLRLPGLRRGAGNIVSLALPRSGLPAGRYRLTLRQGPGEGRAVHDYALRIDAAGDATSSRR